IASLSAASRSNTDGRPRPRLVASTISRDIAPMILDRRLPAFIWATYWSKASRYQPPFGGLHNCVARRQQRTPITEFSTAWRGLMDGLMDQISNHSSFEREAAGSPDRRPTRRVRSVAAAGVALALFAAFTYLGFFHHREARAVAPQPAPALETISKPLQREDDTTLGFLATFSSVDRLELRAQTVRPHTYTHLHYYHFLLNHNP